MLYDVIIIGGGPAGLFNAIFSAKKGLKVLLVEKNKKLGKKLLISGSGKCNITHKGDYKDFLKKYGANGKFLKKALYNFSSKDMVEFFQKEGIQLVENEKGKFFPSTMKSIDVLNLLLKICIKNKVEIKVEEQVLDLEKKDFFTVKTEKNQYFSKKILISTGGKSYPTTGSDGFGYELAKKMGHSIEEIKPCLTPIFVKDYSFSELSGISFYNISMMIIRENKIIHKSKGDLIFTHKNLSGPIILDNSRYMKKEDIISFNFINKDYEIFNDLLLNKISINGNKSIKNLLIEFDLPERFIKKILKIKNINDNKKVSEISKKERNKIINSFVNYKFEVSRLASYEIAMATKGGIKLNEVNNKTMESKIVKNLYFAGEIVDIDGDTGGYNIQAACSMGVLAAKNF